MIKIKKTITILSFIILLISIINIINLVLNSGGGLNFTCVSVLRTQDFTNDFISNETVTLVMKPDRSGYISFSGEISYKNKTTNFSRDIRYNYEKESGELYRFYDIITVKHPRDNTPDELVDSIFFSTSHDKARHMTASKIQNAYIIGNLHSPVFMCVVK